MKNTVQQQVEPIVLPGTAFALGLEDGAQGKSEFTGYEYFVGPRLEQYRNGWAAGVGNPLQGTETMNIEQAVQQRLGACPNPTPWELAEVTNEAEQEYFRQAKDWIVARIASEGIEISPDDLEFSFGLIDGMVSFDYDCTPGYVSVQVDGEISEPLVAWFRYPLEGGYRGCRSDGRSAAFTQFVDAVIFASEPQRRPVEMVADKPRQPLVQMGVGKTRHPLVQMGVGRPARGLGAAFRNILRLGLAER